uniref:Uncharacterized protein n=1 Tax=Trypanosoma congolense (strain IL3000) TaxID=1068625 RepID=G0UQM6_TRYCI|nr:hypothetical protein, unlikely [Trypanosoma congolense IL3000]
MVCFSTDSQGSATPLESCAMLHLLLSHAARCHSLMCPFSPCLLGLSSVRRGVWVLLAGGDPMQPRSPRLFLTCLPSLILTTTPFCASSNPEWLLGVMTDACGLFLCARRGFAAGGLRFGD